MIFTYPPLVAFLRAGSAYRTRFIIVIFTGRSTTDLCFCSSLRLNSIRVVDSSSCVAHHVGRFLHTGSLRAGEIADGGVDSSIVASSLLSLRPVIVYSMFALNLTVYDKNDQAVETLSKRHSHAANVMYAAKTAATCYSLYILLCHSRHTTRVCFRPLT